MLMKIRPLLLGLAALLPLNALSAAPSLTLYNENFAVVRDTVPLDLRSGVNDITFTGTTALLEPDSVILRDPAEKVALQILEQSYRNDPVSQGLLLSYYEGQEIEFETPLPATGEKRRVKGRIVRSGYTPQDPMLAQRYGHSFYQSRMQENQPIIEVEGKLQFGLPGQPIFPALHGDAILKPTLNWKIEASQAGKLDAELAYVTGGMSWKADYNIVAPEKGDGIDVVGWITMDNQSGRTFESANIKLMAGDVSKIQPENAMMRLRTGFAMADASSPQPQVTEKSFDEYHLYTLQRPATLRDRETKQVEFLRATGAKSERVYVYDGLKETGWRNYPMQNIRNNESFGTECDTKVAVMREFRNSKENRLGIPLPKGKVRFYRKDSDGRLEFTGENEIDHTPKDETLRIYTGNAFDLVGERLRTNIKVENARSMMDESFKITLRNRKEEPVEIRVVEHLYRWTTWEITQSSLPHEKKAAQVIEFRVPLKPGEEKELTYTVHYTW